MGTVLLRWCSRGKVRDMPTLFYRYVGEQEKDFIEKNAMIKSKSSRGTYFTTNRHSSAAEAQQELALSRPPEYRIGPIPADEMPDLDKVPLQPAGLYKRQSGGGVEGATTHPVYLYSVERLR